MAKQFIIKDVAGNSGLAEGVTREFTDLATAQRAAVSYTGMFKLGLADFRVFELVEVEA